MITIIEKELDDLLVLHGDYYNRMNDSTGKASDGFHIYSYESALKKFKERLEKREADLKERIDSIVKGLKQCQAENTKLKAKIKSFNSYQSQGIPKDSGDVYLLKIDTSDGWQFIPATVKGGRWILQISNLVVTNPNYYKLLTSEGDQGG